MDAPAGDTAGVAAGRAAGEALRNAARCCCGHADCELLRQNATALSGLEEDVRQAATMGQALLVRHEAYMADAEKERHRLVASVEQLEEEKRALEIQNVQKIRENRDLLEQLEGLNDALAESDAQVKDLTAALNSVHEELQRLTLLTTRTENLERQLAEIEKEQVQLQEDLAAKVEDERSAIQRWRQAERTIASLQDQIDQIEREAQEERARHVEVVGRMERRREVEKELQSAAGRLKGAAAMKSAGNGGSNIVSHFVKDILKDNATLQMGIVELREMLMNSNEEVERLRHQLLLHQPVEEQPEQARGQTLQKELAVSPDESKKDLELHVHHHYYGPENKGKAAASRRTKKKRHVITPAHFTPPRGHTPRSSISRAAGIPSPLAPPGTAILSQTSVTVPQNKRWSLQSSVSYDSSAPASPYSRSHRTSSIFDRVFTDAPYDDSSRPTSPESMASPPFTPLKDLSDVPQMAASCPEDTYLDNGPSLDIPKGLKPRTNGLRIHASPIPLLGKSSATIATASYVSPLRPVTTQAEPSLEDPHPTILEEPEVESLHSDNTTTPGLSSSRFTPTMEEEEEQALSPTSTDLFQPKLRRKGSHESFISVSGMDIHTSSTQYRTYVSSLSPLPSSFNSTQPVLSNMTATRTITATRSRHDSKGALSQSLLHGLNGSPRSTSRTSSISSHKEQQPLAQKLGGWVFGKWGFTPVTFSTPPDASPKSKKIRPPGINQPGPILGLGPEQQDSIPFKLTVEQLDADALGDALREG